MSVEGSVQSVRDICRVSEARARELIESASGSVERAIEIHFTVRSVPPPPRRPPHPPSTPQQGTSTAITATSGKARAGTPDASTSDVSPPTAPGTLPGNEKRPAAAPAPQQNGSAGRGPRRGGTPQQCSSGSPPANKRPRQGTLHRFLGLDPPAPPPKEPNPQRTLDGFFHQPRHRTAADDEAPRVVPTAATARSDPEGRGTAEGGTPGGGGQVPRHAGAASGERPEEAPPPDAVGVRDDATAAAMARVAPAGSTPPHAKAAAGHSADGASVEDGHPALGSRTGDDNDDEEAPAGGAARRSTLPQAPEAPLGRNVPYAWLAATLAELSGTTKRTAKLEALVRLWSRVLESVGGISRPSPPVEDSLDDAQAGRDTVDAEIFSVTLDLIMGRLSAAPRRASASPSRGASTSVPPQPIPLQVSGSSATAAVEAVTGASRRQLRDAYRTLGDLGDCAARYFEPRSAAQKYFGAAQRSAANKELTLGRVHELLWRIATVTPGKGSQKARQDLMVQLLRASRSKDEVRFLVRTLLGNMRLGATLKTIVASLATAFDQACQTSVPNYATPADPGQALQEVFNLCPRLDRIFAALLRGGIPAAVQHCSAEVGFPIQPMLANPAHSLEDVRSFMTTTRSGGSASPEEAAAQWWEADAEWKYDGVRCQAHWDGATTKLFSRNLLENTAQYPDAVAYLQRAKHPTVASFIVDAELVGVAESPEGRDGLRLLPFQDLSTRRGAHSSDDARVQVRVYAFDLLYLNGESLLKQPLWRRQELLRSQFSPSRGFGFATSVPIPRYDQALIEAALQESIRDGAEGLMIKLTGRTNDDKGLTVKGDVDAKPTARAFGYESGVRSQLWLKLKRDYVSGFGETTVDVVPIGAWLGTGRKAQKGFLSPVLFAIYDEDEGAYYSISRCMSFSDDMYVAMREFYFHGTPYPDGVGMGEEVPNGEGTSTSLDPGNAGGDGPIAAVPPQMGLESGDHHEDGNEGDDSRNDSTSRVNCLKERPSWIVTNESPPIWFKPLEVFEVSFADLSLSRSHTAAANLVGDPDGRGVALRFPRFKRRRPDKAVEQATSSEDVARLFFQQSKVKP